MNITKITEQMRMIHVFAMSLPESFPQFKENKNLMLKLEY